MASFRNLYERTEEKRLQMPAGVLRATTLHEWHRARGSTGKKCVQ